MHEYNTVLHISEKYICMFINKAKEMIEYKILILECN